ncbi:hypothetical protein G6F63_015633 [Rhizopus arrhizus]|nr:hypothetical protein G6F63_015633 [Rhizopus arrhizus]
MLAGAAGVDHQLVGGLGGGDQPQRSVRCTPGRRRIDVVGRRHRRQERLGDGGHRTLAGGLRCRRGRRRIIARGRRAASRQAGHQCGSQDGDATPHHSATFRPSA